MIKDYWCLTKEDPEAFRFWQKVGTIKGICCECGQFLDGYHVWQYHYQGKDYCEYHRPLGAYRINS